jgi:hypothetical protein
MATHQDPQLDTILRVVSEVRQEIGLELAKAD